MRGGEAPTEGEPRVRLPEWRHPSAHGIGAVGGGERTLEEKWQEFRGAKKTAFFI